MDFDWMQPRRRPVHDSDRVLMYRREVAQRAALFYRLGYSLEHAVDRLQANAEWDFEIGTPRPQELDAESIAEIARATYRRRPAH